MGCMSEQNAYTQKASKTVIMSTRSDNPELLAHECVPHGNPDYNHKIIFKEIFWKLVNSGQFVKSKKLITNNCDQPDGGEGGGGARWGVGGGGSAKLKLTIRTTD